MGRDERKIKRHDRRHGRRDRRKKRRGRRKICNPLVYGILKICSAFLSRTKFGAKFLRNELRGKKGPIVVVANHQAAFDFVNMVRSTNKRINIVVSNSFYQTLPVKGLMDKAGVIPKQQFQTSPADMRAMKTVVDYGGILSIYPAGLMCEDGLSTPIPAATWRFLQWMGSDVYVIRSTGTYFCTPKWSRVKRKGRTLIDVYLLFTKEELKELSIDEIKKRGAEALDFDAYRENDELKIEYENGDNIEGLENVLYMCPHCGREFTMRVRDKSTIYCTECGFAEVSDRCGMLTKVSEVGEEIRYVSDWARMILSAETERAMRGEDITLASETEILTVDKRKKKFKTVGEGRLVLDRERMSLGGEVDGAPFEISVPAACFPSLPFGPGKYVEVQDGEDIYRCMLKRGELAMKYINTLKVIHLLDEAKEAEQNKEAEQSKEVEQNKEVTV